MGHTLVNLAHVSKRYPGQLLQTQHHQAETCILKPDNITRAQTRIKVLDEDSGTTN